MRLKEAISRADALRPNLIDIELKAEWLYQLEGEYAELFGVELPENSFIKGGEETELLMGRPHDNSYVLYLCAMIDNALSESALYANDMVVANAAIAAAKADYRRHNMPRQNKENYWKVMK